MHCKIKFTDFECGLLVKGKGALTHRRKGGIVRSCEGRKKGAAFNKQPQYIIFLFHFKTKYFFEIVETFFTYPIFLISSAVSFC